MSARHQLSADLAGAAVPAHLRVYVEVLGPDLALDFLLEFGGATFYLAADPKGKSEIAAFLGLDLTGRLVGRLRDQYVHSYVRIPTAKPWIGQVLRDRGMTVAAIARKLHVTDMTVSSWLRKDNRQMELF